MLHLFPFDKTGARSYSPCTGVQEGGARGEGWPNRPGGRGGQGRGLDVLQPHHRHPSPPRLPSHQAHTPPREGEGGANIIEILLIQLSQKRDVFNRVVDPVKGLAMAHFAPAGSARPSQYTFVPKASWLVTSRSNFQALTEPHKLKRHALANKQ